MKTIHKLATILTKVSEIGHWVALALMTAAAVCMAAAPQWVHYFIGLDTIGGKADLSVYGFEITADVINGKVDTASFVLFAIDAILAFGLMAMIFRNLYLILKKSEQSSPFAADNIRMLREIGIFSISIPLIGYLMSIISRLVIGYEIAEVSSSTEGFVFGLVILCLTEFFIYGAKLEKDVDGLL